MQRRTVIGLSILAALGVLGVIVVKNREAIASGLVDLTYTPPPEAGPFLATIKAAADQSGVPWQLIARQIQEESHFDPNIVASDGGSSLMQLTPRYYQGIDLFDPESNINAGVSTDAGNYNKYGNWAKTLAAYNAGDGTVDKGIAAATAAGAPENWLLYLPQSPAKARVTRRYVGQILTDVPLESLPNGAFT